MEMMLHTCVSILMSMRGTVAKLEEWRSNFKEKSLRRFVLVYKYVYVFSIVVTEYIVYH